MNSLAEVRAYHQRRAKKLEAKAQAVWLKTHTNSTELSKLENRLARHNTAVVVLQALEERLFNARTIIKRAPLDDYQVFERERRLQNALLELSELL